MINKALTSLTNEQALINQAKADRAAFAAIYDFYFARIYNYVRYRVWDSYTADDLTADVFETVLNKLHSYQPERGEFSAWLFTIARNRVNYYLRKQKIRQWLSLEHVPNLTDKKPMPGDLFIKNETQHALLQAVAQLSTRERELIALKFASGLTNRTISKMTGLKESHVAVILHRAIKRIRAQMDKESL